MLELDEGQLSRPVLRGRGSCKASPLPDYGTAEVLDEGTGRELPTLNGPTGPVTRVTFSPDGQRILSAGGDTVNVWDSATGLLLLTLKGRTESVLSAAFSPVGKQIDCGRRRT